MTTRLAGSFGATWASSDTGIEMPMAPATK